MAKIILTDKDGTAHTIELRDEVIALNIVDMGMRVNVVFPREDGFGSGSVHTVVAMNELKYPTNYPEVQLTAGEYDEKGWTSRTDASMYVTYNGRIMGRNGTLGYANTEKPLATKPWIATK